MSSEPGRHTRCFVKVPLDSVASADPRSPCSYAVDDGTLKDPNEVKAYLKTLILGVSAVAPVLRRAALSFCPHSASFLDFKKWYLSFHLFLGFRALCSALTLC